MRTKFFTLLILLSVVNFGTTLASATALSLPQAVELALQLDPIIEKHSELAAAQQSAALAAGVLPDPKLKLALQALPTDSFSRNQEPMTQLQVGLVQKFPRGNTLQFRQAKLEELAAAQQAAAAQRDRVVKRQVRDAYLALLYQRKSNQIIESNKFLFAELVEITQSHYAVGINNQQDVLQAKLQLGMLDERLLQTQQAEQRAQAQLGKWIGAEAAKQPTPLALPRLPNLPDAQSSLALLTAHPLVQQSNANIRAAQQEVAIAKEQYKPGWQIDLTYGQRAGQNPNGDDRADFLSSAVVLDVPIFREKKQDKQLAARQRQAQAARLSRSELLLELRRQLDQHRIDWHQLQLRESAYNDLLKQAHDTSEAALRAYQSGVSDFATLLRARIQEFETRLKALRITIDQRKAHTALLYLLGEAS